VIIILGLTLGPRALRYKLTTTWNLKFGICRWKGKASVENWNIRRFRGLSI
jgi:hypothetical protein